MTQPPIPQFQAASASGGGNCVEVAFTGDVVQVRNSRNHKVVITMTREQWQMVVVFVGTFTSDELAAFVAGILSGDPRVTGV